MNQRELKGLISNLSWNMPEEVQLSAIENLMQIDDAYTPQLIQDSNKSCWENAVKILYDIGYPRNRYAIPRLIWLMQDINWPGVSLSIDLLKVIDKRVTLPHIESALIKAAADKDYMWIGGIQRLLNELNISEEDFSRKEVFELLKLSDW